MPPKMTLPRITSPDHGRRRPLGSGLERRPPSSTRSTRSSRATTPCRPSRRSRASGYDDKFFYASFWCEDPDISKIRAPFVDRDGINDDQDYVGILLDVDNQNHSAIDFWIGPRGIQADSVFYEGTVQRGLRAGLLLAVRRHDRHGLLDGGGRDPARPRCATRRRTRRTGRSMLYRDVSARSQLPVLQRPRAARLELLSLQLGDGRGHHGAAAGRALGPRALRRGHRARRRTRARTGTPTTTP